jgi:electron transfer flavoprotein beta subunit
MNIIVCIKQVPDTTDVKIDPVTKTLVREGVPSIINPFDENAIEAAVQLREQFGGQVTVMTMGPPQAEAALRDAVAMGADEAILLCDRTFAGSDTWATSYALSRAVRKIAEYDLIICGKQAFDGDTAQVGPGLAEWLGIPQITYAIEIGLADSRLRVRRLLETGFEVVEVKPPALVTVVKQINEPRMPGLKSKLAAKKKQITTWTAADVEAEPGKCGLDGSPTNVVEVFAPSHDRHGELIEGAVSEQVGVLFEKLREQKVL